MGPRRCAVAVVLAGCAHQPESPQPTLAAIAPDLACNGPIVSTASGITTVTLTGAQLTPLPSRTLADTPVLLLPSVTLAPVGAVPGGAVPTAPVALADDPANAVASRVSWLGESEMTFAIDPADGIPSGVFDVVVQNPDGAHAATLPRALAVIPPPTASAIMSIAPQTVRIAGAGFLVYAGAAPTVMIGNRSVAASAQAADCAPIGGALSEANAQLCTAIEAVVPPGQGMPFVVVNPSPADCAAAPIGP